MPLKISSPRLLSLQLSQTVNTTNTLKRILFILFLFCSLSASAYGQGLEGEARTGSFYSGFGAGFPQDIGNSTAEGMGLLGVSYVEPYVAGVGNPAHWGSTVLGMATGGLSLQQFKASDSQGSSQSARFNANNFQIQLPIYRDKLGISASLRPYSHSAFSRVKEDELVLGTGDDAETLAYQVRNNGDGGFNNFEVGAGWKINSNISVGYAASVIFASIDDEYNVAFDNSNYRPANYTLRTSGAGIGHRFGLQFELADFSVGAAGSLPVTVSGEREERSQNELGGGLETVIVDEGQGLGKGDIDLPMSLQGGMTYAFSNELSVSAEGLYEEWSQYRSDFEQNADQLLDRYKMGMGMRYRPYTNDDNTGFFSQFKYTLGTSYDTGHIELNDRNIETLMFSFGLGIFSPRGNSNSSVDIGFQYGFRGTEAQNLVKENIWGLKLSFNLAELMFNRPKLR